MKIVVTGGAGFIGSNLVDALLARGHEVVAIDDFSTGNTANIVEAKKSSKFQIENVKIESPVAAEIIKSFKPEVVFHLAAQMDVRKSVVDPVFDAQVNVLGTVNLLQAAHEAGSHKFVMSSTGGAIYGEQESFPADENHITRPKCPYGVSKRAGEIYLEYFALHTKLDTVSLRFANVYGPRQNSKGEAGVVAIFSEKALKGETLTINGDGLQTRDFVHVNDVIAANLAVLDSHELEDFEIFNVGTGIEHNVVDIVDVIKYEAEKQNPGKIINVVHGPALSGEQRRSVVDASSLAKRLGVTPKWEFREGIADTFRWFSQKA